MDPIEQARHGAPAYIDAQVVACPATLYRQLCATQEDHGRDRQILQWVLDARRLAYLADRRIDDIAAYGSLAWAARLEPYMRQLAAQAIDRAVIEAIGIGSLEPIEQAVDAWKNGNADGVADGDGYTWHATHPQTAAPAIPVPASPSKSPGTQGEADGVQGVPDAGDPADGALETPAAVDDGPGRQAAADGGQPAGDPVPEGHPDEPMGDDGAQEEPQTAEMQAVGTPPAATGSASAPDGADEGDDVDRIMGLASQCSREQYERLIGQLQGRLNDAYGTATPTAGGAPGQAPGGAAGAFYRQQRFQAACRDTVDEDEDGIAVD